MTALLWFVSLPAWLYVPAWLLLALPVAWLVTRVLELARRHDGLVRHQRAVASREKESQYRNSVRLRRAVNRTETEGRRR